MKGTHKLIGTVVFVLVSSSMLFASPAGLVLPKSLVASANGKGTLKVGEREEFQLHGVVVKLTEDGKAELSLVSDITVFFTGTWTGDDPMKGIDLKISGGATDGSLTGAGKLVLRDDGKSISTLTMDVTSKISKRTIKVNFTAQ